RIDDRVRTVGADHPAGPAAAADRLVGCERIGGTLGGRQNFDVELLEQCPGSEGRTGERGTDGVEIQIGGLGLETHVQAEHLRKYLVEPERRRCAAKERVVAGKLPPGLTR